MVKIKYVFNWRQWPSGCGLQRILNLTGLEIKMSHYNLTAKGEGAEALGQVDIVVEHEGRKFHGVGLATDIVESSALALVHAINAIYRAHKVADIKSHKHH